jgi:hypothetical protein
MTMTWENINKSIYFKENIVKYLLRNIIWKWSYQDFDIINNDQPERGHTVHLNVIEQNDYKLNHV